MADESKSYSTEERYALIDKLIEEVKLRRYSYQTGKAYVFIVKNFLASCKTPREFLLAYTTKSKSTMRSAYFALKFFYENVLNTKFDEKLPLARKSLKLPLVLSKEEIKFLVQLVGSLEDAELKLEQAYSANDINNFKKIKSFIERVQKSVDFWSD